MRFAPLRLLAVALFVSSVGLAAETAPPAAAAAADTPEVASAKEWLVKLFDSSKNVNGSSQKTARAHIEASLDWDEVARTCLGEAEWKKQAGKNRTEFRNLLKDVILRTAFSRMDKFWDGSTYTWEKVTVSGNKATLRVKFAIKEDTYVLDYYLEKAKGGWRITDLAFEDLRYSTNINEQLTAFLKEKNFGQLLTNLKKKRDDLASGKKG